MLKANFTKQYIDTGRKSDSNIGREVSCRVLNLLIKYLVSRGYNISSLFEGIPYTEEYISNPFNRVPYLIREKICQRAAELTKDGAVMYQVGLHTTKLQLLTVSLLCNPEQAYRDLIKYSNVFEYSNVFDRVFKVNISITGHCKATFKISLPKGYQPSKNLCYYFQGVLAAIPTQWGLIPAEVYERQCMCQYQVNDNPEDMKSEVNKCIYELKWQEPESWYMKLADKIFRYPSR